MAKLIPLLILSLLAINLQTVFAVESVQNKEEVAEEYDFEAQSSKYLTDEQLQAAQEVHEIDDKSSFLDKIINSSHFSSNTATKTYIPINKVQK